MKPLFVLVFSMLVFTKQISTISTFPLPAAPLPPSISLFWLLLPLSILSVCPTPNFLPALSWYLKSLSCPCPLKSQFLLSILLSQIFPLHHFLPYLSFPAVLLYSSLSPLCPLSKSLSHLTYSAYCLHLLFFYLDLSLATPLLGCLSNELAPKPWGHYLSSHRWGSSNHPVCSCVFISFM